LKVKDFTNGQIKDLIMETDKTTRCMVKEFFVGLMAENMKVNIIMTKNKDMEYLNGQMEENI